MLQIVGSILLLGSSAAVGWQLARVEMDRVQHTEGLLLLLRHIRTGIVCYANPITDIYKDFQNPALERCGFLPCLRSGGLLQALDACGNRLHVDGEDMRTLRSFAASVGRGFSRDQAAICDYTIAALERSLTHRQGEAPRRVRAAGALSVCGGLMLLLLLL